MITKIKKVDRLINWGAKDPKTGKTLPMYDNCKDEYVPGLNRDTGALRTGMTEKEEIEFEQSLGLERGSLAKSSKYWSTYKIAIPADGLTINTSNPRERLQYQILKADPTVVLSVSELRTNAAAEYIMITESGEAKVSNSKRNVIAQAYAKYVKLTQAETVDALFMFGKDPSDLDFEVCQNRLGELVEEDPGKFLNVVGDKLFKDKVYFMKLIKAGIVKKHGTGTGTDMPLYFEDIMLGSGLEESIAYIKDVENQQIAMGIQSAYKKEIKK
jgi:hypothetical protein